MSVPGVPNLTHEDKAGRIFDALNEHGKLTRVQIMELTGMTRGQFRNGWSYLRRQLGTIAIVDNHREATTYRLSNEPSIEAERYRLWQDRTIYSRLWSLRATLRQMREIAKRTDEADGEALLAADQGIGDAIAAMKGEVRRAGMRAGVDETEVERMLDAVAAR